LGGQQTPEQHVEPVEQQTPPQTTPLGQMHLYVPPPLTISTVLSLLQCGADPFGCGQIHEISCTDGQLAGHFLPASARTFPLASLQALFLALKKSAPCI
jgi:hypothetical protein